MDEAGNYGTSSRRTRTAQRHQASDARRRPIDRARIFADDEALALIAERGTYLVADVWAGDWMEEEGPQEGVAG